MTAYAHVHTPNLPDEGSFETAEGAVGRLKELYQGASSFLCDQFIEVMQSGRPERRIRAFYPELRITTNTFAAADTRLSFGHVVEPGRYSTTITRPDLFDNYLTQQIGLLIKNHGIPVQVGVSQTPMPVHFAVANDAILTVPQEGATDFSLRDVFDVPDLASMNDDIVNGHWFSYEDGSHPLAPFTAQRVDYSLSRLSHYTAPAAEHLQNIVLITNYQI